MRDTPTVPGHPDRAELTLTVTALEACAQSALEGASVLAERLSGVLGRLALGPEQWSTSGATVHEELQWDGSRQVHRGFRGTYQVAVRLTDASLIGRLVQDSVEVAGAQVAGPWWRTDPSNPAHLEASRLAAATARSKAEAYAGGLGVRAASVLAVREPDTGSIAGLDTGHFQMAAAVPEIPRQGLDVRPGALDVTAAVEVTFRLEPA